MEQKITIPDGFTLEQISETEYRVVKKEKDLPETWEQFCNMYRNTKGEWFISKDSKINEIDLPKERLYVADKNLLPNKEKAEAILALCQLIQLRDCYNDGWKPDWTDNCTYKYCIQLYTNDLREVDNTVSNEIFAFETEKLRDKFLKNFKDLLEKVKPLFY